MPGPDTSPSKPRPASATTSSGATDGDTAPHSLAPPHLTDEPLRAFIRESRDGIVIIDEHGTVVEWNQGEERLTGIERAEAVGRPIWEIQHRVAPAARRGPQYVRDARERTLRGLAEGTALQRTLEEHIELPGGVRRTIHSLLFGFRSGQALYAAGISRDVTEAARMAEELRERQQLLLAAERAVRLGHWTRDLRTDESRWSDEVYRILGSDPDGQPPPREAFLGSIIEEDRAAVAAAVAGAEADGVARHLRFRLLRSDGSVRHVQATVDLLRDDAGAPARVLGTLQDVTERVALEQNLAAALRNKDEFLTVLSHELRNPIAALRNGLYVLARAEPGSDPSGQMLAIVERQAAHLTRLVDDLLDVSRIERGKIRIRREPLELAEFVRRAAEDLRPMVAAAKVQLDVRVTQEPMWVRADATRLAQVISNLLGNSAKFTPRGGRIEVVLERSGAEGLLTVADTGVGISAEMLERVFEPFAQADRTLDRTRGGLGLGLALVKRLVELHGGSVTAESAGPGRGARFVVRLPVGDTAPTPAPRRAESPVPPRRVLVVEDDPDVAATLAEALRIEGHEVSVARDGIEAIALARALTPEVVLCDLTLPNLDGLEVARALRQDAALSGTMLVALTGQAFPEDVQRSHRAGFQRHLSKPATLEAIEEILRQAGRGSGEPASGDPTPKE